MSARARVVSVGLGVAILVATAGCGADARPTSSTGASTSAPIVVEATPTDGPVSDAALVAAARADIPPGTLPDGMYLAEEITVPGLTTVAKVYATAAYAGGGRTGPVVVVSERPLTEENRALFDGPGSGAVLLPEISPGAVLVSRGGEASVCLNDGTTLVFFASTRYDADHLVAFVASVAESLDS